jgi:hypothetical protein
MYWFRFETRRKKDDMCNMSRNRTTSSSIPRNGNGLYMSSVWWSRIFDSKERKMWGM